MTVRDLYEGFTRRIPAELSEPWDNDGLMCCADETKEVKRVLVSLDVTDEIVDYAISGGFDLIISHHPLIFKPVSNLNQENHVSRKLIKLITADISVMSFHTRADKVSGGVNDCLARRLGLFDIAPLGEDGLGRIGHLETEMGFEEFAGKVKSAIGAEHIIISDAYTPVYTVALVGGDGKDYVPVAIDAGADTYISGRISYNIMEEASEIGINMIEAGHNATEFPVTEFFASLVSKLDSRIYVEVVGSNMLRVI